MRDKFGKRFYFILNPSAFILFDYGWFCCGGAVGVVVFDCGATGVMTLG
jgi:hypothetical protein